MRRRQEFHSAQTAKQTSKFSIEAFVARVLKMNKVLAYEQILGKCRARFKDVQPEAVQAAVQSLISSFNIKLSEEKANTYIYS